MDVLVVVICSDVEFGCLAAVACDGSSWSWPLALELCSSESLNIRLMNGLDFTTS